MKNKIAKFVTSESIKNTEAETRNAKRDASLKPIGSEAALETPAIESATTPSITEPTPAPEPAALTVATPSPAKTKKAAKKEKPAAKPVKSVVDTATLFANFNAKHASTPIVFRETLRDAKRYAAVVAAEKFEDALPTFKDAADLRSFMMWVLRGAPGYKQGS
jgi:hypothetical protein